MKKLIIVGTTCTGKSTLGKQLHEISNVKWFDLDDFHWLPNWLEKEDDLMIKDIKTQILTEEKWIVSGNYISKMTAILWTEADTIIWLNYPLFTILCRCFKRTLSRIIFKEKVCNGNVETLKGFLSNPENNLFYWIFKTYKKRIKTFCSLKNGRFKDLSWIVLKNQKEANIFLDKIRNN